MDEYDPSWSSLDEHQIPDWFRDAKLGIFIHWGVYSVPAWAPSEAEIGGESGSPYAEWYPYFMYEDGSPTKAYHEDTYGPEVEYSDFIEEFTAENWDPDEWASLFEDVGAGYVVLTGEHHDGFPLWDTHYTRYNAKNTGPERDLVGDLAKSVREYGLRFAASYHANFNYYQPGFEGQFGHPDYEKGGPNDEEGGPGAEYVSFMLAKHRELIRKHHPDLLWFDVPKADSDQVNAKELIADYYNQARQRDQEVAVNDRAATDTIGPTMSPEDWTAEETHGDFITPEYATFDEMREEPWEGNRGIGHSFGYNSAEEEEDHISAEKLVHVFVDIVSKNGNLLLNIGPKADGTIPAIQKQRLQALGSWLEIHGDGIFGSRPWVVAEDSESKVEVRYTYSGGDLYAFAFDWPADELRLSLPNHIDLTTEPDAALMTEQGDESLETALLDDELVIQFSGQPTHRFAYGVRLADIENPRLE
jgi:alpha-L-fucosidase